MADALATRVCIVGGGPCGMMLGVLMARAGIDVTVLEKYGDFFRDFRGDTIHPSTLELLYELGWIDDFLKLPHDEAHIVGANVAGEDIKLADFHQLPTHCKFIAFMPQWDFLNFLADKGKQYPTFHLLMETEGVDLIEAGGAVTGVRARRKDGSELTIHADLVVGTDGRHSTVRERAGFNVIDLGSPIDVLWMRIPKHPDDAANRLGNLNDGVILVTIDRGEYWQCALVIAKDSYASIRAKGLGTLHAMIATAVPALAERAKAIDDWSKVSLLEVRVDRLERWHRPGVLCIGDAAHAMSPIGGIGINLAIQDAVAAANRLAAPMHEPGTPSDDVLAAIQKRRMFPTEVTQAFQTFLQDRAIDPVLQGREITRPPLPMRLLNEFPALRGLPARLLGLGVRREHIRTPDAFTGS